MATSGKLELTIKVNEFPDAQTVEIFVSQILTAIMLSIFQSDRLSPNINFCDCSCLTEQEQTFKCAISNGLRSLAEKLKSYFWSSKSMLGEPKRRFHRITKKNHKGFSK